MANDPTALIARITEQVLAAMRAESGTLASPAPIHPPVGTCTGDYSKFKDPAAKSNVGEPRQDTIAPGSSSSSRLPALRGFVTANRLAAAAASGAVIRLASCAKLTPAATDYAKEKKLTFERATAGSSAGKSTGGVTRTSDKWAWWIDGRNDGVDHVAAQLRSSLTPLAARRQPTGLIEAIASMAKFITSGKAAGGVLFVESAAAATCLANRCPVLRAVVAMSPAAVDDAIAQVAANVLIIEYNWHGPAAMRALVERFIAQPRPDLGAIARRMQEAASCV
ncbi:MAG: hypothetical protein GC162_10495 [Planctomycetes bacterium]|nr:hypothetical protein [Planctomycetota bacterium]